MSQNAVQNQFVLLRIEGATDVDAIKAADQMSCWTPKDIKVYDKRDGTGVFIYARFYLKKQATVAPVRSTEPQRIPPRVVSRPAPTRTGYDDSEDREYADQTDSPF